MVSSKNKIRMRRLVRTRKRSAEQAGDKAAEHFDVHVVSRWQNFLGVRRFVAGWLFLVFVLGAGVLLQQNDLKAYHQIDVSADGGVYIEGAVGDMTNFNPIFATSAPDVAVSHLIFNSLLTYDENNKLVGDLAQSWEFNKSGTKVVIRLKPDVKWQDGEPLTADDVVYTVQTIQHPDTRSPLNVSWQGITVEAIDERTVVFELPNQFAPFLHSLTFGILPEHVLRDITPLEMRAYEFNVQPLVGTGPFRFNQLTVGQTSNQVDLVANESYFDGMPRIERFVVRAFEDHEKMVQAFNDKQLTGASGLRSFDFDAVENVEKKRTYSIPLYNTVFMFLKNSDEILKDQNVRQALTRATDRARIFDIFENRYPIARGPFLASQLGYKEGLNQFGYNPEKAAEQLDEAGWKLRADGIRYKKDVPLEIAVVTQSSDEFPVIVNELQRQWSAVGVLLKPQLVSSQDLQQSHIVPHNYQSLLVSVSLGVDPDQFVYWHSSQAAVGGFNFAEFKNSVVDEALEAGRTRDDNDLRNVKYQAFSKEWRLGAPAIALYQNGFGYVQDQKVRGMLPKKMVEPADRFSMVETWTVNTQTVTKPY